MIYDFLFCLHVFLSGLKMSLLKASQSAISPLSLQNTVNYSESQQTDESALYVNTPSTITASTFPSKERWGFHLVALSDTLMSDVGQQDHLFSDTAFCLEMVTADRRDGSVQKQEGCNTLLQPYSHQPDCLIKTGLMLPLPPLILIIQKCRY